MHLQVELGSSIRIFKKQASYAGVDSERQSKRVDDLTEKWQGW